MLEHDRIDISERIDFNKTNASKERDICHYWYFLDKKVKYEPYLCNGCHDLTRKTINCNDVAITSVKGSNYRINFWYETISIMNNFNLNEKSGLIQIFF